MKIILSFVAFFGLNLALGQTDYPLETVLQNGHVDYITAYDYSADGQLLITGSFDNVLILWDFESGKQIRTFSGHTKRIRTIKISPNQELIASVGADNRLFIFELITGKVIHQLTIPRNDLFSAYFSKNGAYIYALDNRDGVHVWDVKTGEYQGRYVKEYAAFHEDGIIHPDGNEILSVDGYKGALKIDLSSGDTLLRLPFDKVYSQSFSPNGQFIAVSSQKLFASIFDAKTGKLLFELRDGEQQCDGCNTLHVFSPDSDYLLTMSSKVGAILWDVKTGKKIRTYTEINKRPKQLAFSAKGKYLLVCFSDQVFIFDTQSGKLKLMAESDKMDYLVLGISPDEEFIVLPNDESGIDIWSVSKGKVVKTIRGYLNQSQFGGLNLSYSNWLDQGILNTIQSKRKVLLSPNDQYIAIGGIDSSLQFIDLERGKVFKTFTGHHKAVLAFDFSHDGKYLATGGGDRLIKIWETASGQLIQTLHGHQETIFDLKFNAEGTAILSGAWDGTMRLWDLRTGTYEYVDLGGTSPISVAFSPNELYLLTTDLSNNVTFWEKDALQTFRQLVGFTDVASNVDFSPSGKLLATSSWDGKVKVWDLLSGMLIAKMEKHAGRVFDVKFDPKDRFIASAGADNQIYLWDYHANTIIGTLKGHSTAITSIDITNDGQRLISISADGVVKVWDLNTKLEVYTRVQLSRNEWLATSPNGLFDGSNKALNWVNYVKGNQVINIKSLFEKYYTPDLIRRIQENDGALDHGSTIQTGDLKEMPDVILSFDVAGKRSVLANSDSIVKATSAILPLQITIDSHTDPLDEMLIYNNGKLINRISLEEEISFRGAGEKTHQLKVDLVNGFNEIEVVLINKQRTSSSPTKVLVEFDGVEQKVDLFLFTIGINTYKNPAYNLDYAVNDAEAFTKAIQAGTDSLFNHVYSYSLLNENATKEMILSQIEEVKKQIGPEDVFLFYYAGHGVMSTSAKEEGSEFFIVTHDVINLYAEVATLRDKAVSASELMAISMQVSAEKQLFILDACHSGGAIETFAVRGSQREKSLAQLARNTGTFFITASQDAEYANEVGQLNHGLFTYALLEILQGTVLMDGDKSITVSELKAYVEERVPALSEEYHGSPQYPTGYSFGRDFPIVIVK